MRVADIDLLDDAFELEEPVLGPRPAVMGKSRGATESLLFRARDSFRRAYGAEDRDD